MLTILHRGILFFSLFTTVLDTRRFIMSLDKAIKYGKERRKEYRGGKSFDKDCRNHGACEICLSNRTIQTKKMLEEAKSKLREGEQ